MMENNQTTGLAPKAYVPPKEWKDITDAEKIDRMREVIKSLQSYLSRAQCDIAFLRENFKKHTHTEKEVVIPFNEYGGNTLNGLAINSNSVGGYF